MAWARSVPRRVVAPKLLEDAGGLWLLLPGDPDYPGATPTAMPPPTRFAYCDGRWKAATRPPS